jgi:hypothetical protein
MSGKQVHHAGAIVLSLAMVAIGIALAAEALGAAGGGLVARLLLGILFVAGGVGRLYVEMRRGRGA